MSGEAPDTVFENLVVRNGSATEGGGMLNERCSPTLNNCTFMGNVATDGDGGGMYISYYPVFEPGPRLSGCYFCGNLDQSGSTASAAI